MGGRCCLPVEGTESSGAPQHHLASDLSENEPSSSTPDTPAAIPGQPDDSNLNTLTIDVYQEHKAPLPPCADSVEEQTSTGSAANYVNTDEHMKPTKSVPFGDVDLKESDSKSAVGCANSYANAEQKDDSCPICLEGFDAENPRIKMKCKHFYHQSCMFELMEMSNTCAICRMCEEFGPDEVMDT